MNQDTRSFSSGRQVLLDVISRIWTHPENRGRRVWALTRFVAWQIWERIVRRPWTVTLLGSLKVRCYPHSPIASAVIYYGLADHMEMRFLLDFLEPGDAFIDVGANVGIYSLVASSVAGVRVLAMEPSSLAHQRAAENIALNRLQDRVTLLREAAGSSSGSAYLTVDFDAMNSLVGEDSGDPKESVTMNSLDNLAREHKLERVTAVKIDVEGWETSVLAGAIALLRDHRPALVVEVNDPAGLELFRTEHGYECVTYDPSDRKLVQAALTEFHGRNAILVPDLKAALEKLEQTEPN